MRNLQLAYSDELPYTNSLLIPVGTTCRLCTRTDCSQRAAPSYKFALRLDEYVKKDNFFSPLMTDDEQD